MGACYSKGSASAKHLKIKAPKFRKHKGEQTIESNHSRYRDDTEQGRDIIHDDCSDEDGEGGQRDSNSALLPQQSVIPDLVSNLDCDNKVENNVTTSSGNEDKGVAPSDSGIESIVEEGTTTMSVRLERLSRGSCHKCGNFKLDDNALTALLSNTYCLCGPRQAGKPSVNPDCQTHGVKKDFKRSQSMPAKCGGEHIGDFNFRNCSSSSPLKSNLKKNNDVSVKKEKTLRISLEDILVLDQDINSCNGDEDEKTLLSNIDSLDNLLEEDAKAQKRLSRRSLLSEILDITDSICKCDFYSNEYCVGQKDSEGINGNLENSFVDVNDTLESLALSGSTTASNCDISNENCNEMASPPKTSSSLSKFVTFAQEKSCPNQDKANGESGSRSCPMSPLKRPGYQNDLRNSVSETSSGVDMQSGDTSGSGCNSNIIESDCQATKNNNLMASQSYDTVDRTEDDMASIDMDSLSRVTSLSYGSIRQLLESTEDLVEPLDAVRRMTIDGEDCVIIPTGTYKQMQSDLTMLKEQLVLLSSLLQEVCGDRAGRENDPRHKKTLSFCSDLDTTPQRRIQYRSQEFVDVFNDQ